MNLDFQQMKPVIQEEFDAVFDLYPTDTAFLKEQIPPGADAYERKRRILEIASAMCPVHIFPHYPFAFELDMGEERDVCYSGVGKECLARSGVDFSPLGELNALLRAQKLASFNHYTDFLHRTMDHDKLLQMGFKGVWEECARLNESESDPEKRRYRELVMHCCTCVQRIGLRLREKAAGMLKDARDEDAVYNLTRIVRSANTPWEPPQTMFDALNSILCTTLFISGLDGVNASSCGPLDRLIWPFFQRELAEGSITEEEAYFLIQCFLHKTDMHCHFNDERKNYDNGVSMMIGGCDPEGNAVYNPVTDMIIRAYTENKLIHPKLNARVCAQSPREYLKKLAGLTWTGNNNLVIQNDEYIIPMFMRMGLSPEDARTYVGNGCQEVICRNQIHSRAFVYLNMPQVLVHTLSYSRDDLPASLQKIYQYGAFGKETYEEMWASFRANLRSLIRTVTETFHPFERLHASINPEPLLSCFTADCIQSGRDNSQGGARYNHKTLSLVGFGTLCDSLLSLQRAYGAGTEKQLLDALASDFAGQEVLRQSLLSSSDRFGHSETADAFAGTLAHELAEISRGITTAQGIPWHTSLFTYYQFREFGYGTGATPDGRHAGDILSRQMNMAKLPALTSAALSMSVLSSADFHDVGMFDFALPYASAATEKARQSLAAFIETCISLKIPVMQPNVVDARLLREECARKGTHPDLVVRVCGYSAIFGQLPDYMQDEIIARSGT